MRWWTRKRRPEPDEEWWEALRRVEGEMRALRLDWESTYDKVREGLARLGKRQKALAASSEPELEANGAPASVTQARLSPEEYGRLIREHRMRRH